MIRMNGARGVTETLEEVRARLAKLSWLRRRLQSAEDGQSAIEFAFCLPVLLLVVTGIITFGMTFSNYIELTEATGVGARLMAIQRGEGGDPCALAASAISGAAPLLKNTNIGYTFTVYTTATTSTTYTTSTCSSAPLTMNMPVTIQTTFPCSMKVYGTNLIPSCIVKAQTTEIVQ